MKTKFLLLAAFALSCSFFTSCGGDDDKGSKTNVDGPTKNEEGKIIYQKVDIPIDNSFKPNSSYLQKEWTGEYTGWDNVQKKNTTIRRKLTLKPNGTYTNIIAGKLIDSGKDEFFKFESEGGKYSYNQSTGYVTYTCEYDSVLKYDDQTYNVYTQKKYYSKSEATYTEKAEFSESYEGKRVWITKDTYLQSLTAEIMDLAFSMSEYAGEQQDQNKQAPNNK